MNQKYQFSHRHHIYVQVRDMTILVEGCCCYENVLLPGNDGNDMAMINRSLWAHNE